MVRDGVDATDIESGEERGCFGFSTCKRPSCRGSRGCGQRINKAASVLFHAKIKYTRVGSYKTSTAAMCASLESVSNVWL
jgi:hypothetical protein